MKSSKQIPRGIEVLVKKASVDSAFCELLIDKRADAANDIGLTLSNAETAMLKAIPEAQLIGIIRKTKVSPKSHTAFMGYVATAMLAAVGVTVGCGEMSEEAEVDESGDIETDTIEEVELTEKSRLISIDPKYRGSTGIRPGTEYEKIRHPKTMIAIISVSGPGSDDEGRTESDISRIIEQRKAGVEYLYRKHRNSSPDLPEGTIVCQFNIGTDGNVGDTEILSDEIGDEALSFEIAARIGTWKFHPNSGEVTVVVSFKFVIEE